MNIQVATFALFPEQIYIALGNFHTDKLILIISDENQNKSDSELNENELTVTKKIEEIINYSEDINISVEKIYVNYKNFIEMVLKLTRLINSFSEEDIILLNLSGGRRAIPIALIYAGMFAANLKGLNISCAIIPEDKTYNNFQLLPKYIPDERDIKIMRSLSKGKSLIQLENNIGIKQPTISVRLKKLEKYGYIFIKGRNRKLTTLGSNIIENFIITDDNELGG